MAEMKTLNGYEVVDAKAREDIAALQASGGSGGGSGIKVITVTANVSTAETAEEKAMWEDIYANENYDDYIVQVSDGYAGNRYTIDSWKVGKSSNYIEAYYTKLGTRHYIRVNFSNGVFNTKLNRDYSWTVSSTSKDWIWSADDIALSGNYQHIKVVVRWDGSDDKIAIYDISARPNSYIWGTEKYYIPDVFNYFGTEFNRRMYFNSTQSYLSWEETNSDYSETIPTYDAEILGFYYWG